MILNSYSMTQFMTLKSLNGTAISVNVSAISFVLATGDGVRIYFITDTPSFVDCQISFDEFKLKINILNCYKNV